MRPRLPIRLVVVVLATLGLVSLACSTSDSDADRDGDAQTASGDQDDSTTTDEPPTTVSGTVDHGDAETDDPLVDGDLPGEPFDLFPYEDADLVVVGVEADDVLHVRQGPGEDFPEVVDLAPLTTDIRAHGVNRLLEDQAGIWALIDVGGETGWANVRYLMSPGLPEDATGSFMDVLAGATLDELAENTAQGVAADLPDAELVIVDRSPDADPPTVTIDILGFGDDSVGGQRLHITAEEGASGFIVKSVESTTLCLRGVTDGLCV